MNQRENFEVMVKGGKPEFAPNMLEAYKLCVLGTNNADQPWQGGMDPFGVNFIARSEGPIPEPNKFLFTDIADWKKYVKFPDIDSLGLGMMAQIELADVDRKEKIIDVISVVGLFERMACFMGFENTLCALIEDPDSCNEFFAAFADYKIATINRMIDLYQPDIITYFDDIATARGLFMSPKTYRELIKPHHKRIVDAVNARGVIFSNHTCGRCEDVIEDYVEIGVKMWNSAQISNDLEGILKKYKGRLIIEGGWDSQGRPGCVDATTEEVVNETIRCGKQYAHYGNFILMPMVMNENGNAAMSPDPRMPALFEAWNKVNKL